MAEGSRPCDKLPSSGGDLKKGAFWDSGTRFAPLPLPGCCADKFCEADTVRLNPSIIRTVAACSSRGTGFGDESIFVLDIRKIENVYLRHNKKIWLLSI
jgi:hypothetical protein